jgi:hypothetical protein
MDGEQWNPNRDPGLSCLLIIGKWLLILGLGVFLLGLMAGVVLALGLV